MRKEAKVDELEDWQRFVVLVIDEMKIREDLVYDKTRTCLHGFVNLGHVNNQLRQLEMQSDTKKPHGCLATPMLTVMVRGILFKHASFPTQGVTCEMLYWIMWEAVRRLEQINLRVIVFVCDGAKSNRKFLRSLGKESEMKHGVVYKTDNRYCRGQHIYLMSDVPHLMKTTRNCWYSSKSGGTRYMWRNGRKKKLLWEHLRYLHDYMQAESGLYVGRRLTYEHINLTSYSKS